MSACRIIHGVHDGKPFAAFECRCDPDAAAIGMATLAMEWAEAARVEREEHELWLTRYMQSDNRIDRMERRR
jgi:hypothetical protein